MPRHAKTAVVFMTACVLVLLCGMPAGHYLTETEPEKVALEIIKFVLNT